MAKRFDIKTVALGAVALGLTGTAVYAALPSNKAIEQVLHARLPKTKFDKIDCKVVRGLCEVQAGPNVFYTDASGRYLIVGRVYDMDTRQDITAARLLQINPGALVGGSAVANAAGQGGEERAANTAALPSAGGPAPGAPAAVGTAKVSLASLPKSGAIGWGSGGPAITVFSDFHCQYCRMLHTTLRGMKVRVIERPISVLGTRMISDAVVCAPDPRKALMRAYEQEDIPAGKKCDTSGLDANEAFARQHGFDGTPVLVRSDGAVIQGFRPREVLEQWLKGARA